jgi:hypothetical protein
VVRARVQLRRTESSFESPACQDMSLGAEKLNCVELQNNGRIKANGRDLSVRREFCAICGNKLTTTRYFLHDVDLLVSCGSLAVTEYFPNNL